MFVNNKDLTFTERASQYGFTDQSRSNQACFFDMDNDGDLDMYLINNPKKHTKTREYPNGDIRLVDVGSTYQDSDKLYENKNGTYVDITKKAGLVNSDYGLGIVAADLNHPKTKRNVIAPIKNTINSKVIQYDLLYPF